MAKTLVLAIWILLLSLLAALTTRLLPFNPSFPYYDTDLSPFYPRLLAIPGHFDGIHYLRLAAHGYADSGSQAFFPLYPLLIRLLSNWGFPPLGAAVYVSLVSLACFARLVSARTLGLVLAFPAGFFLLSAYTESLFLFLLALAMTLLSSRRHFLAAIVIGLLSSVRLAGVLMLIPLALSLWQSTPKKIYLLPIGSLGFLLFIAYLALYQGDALAFLHVQPLFGGGRAGEGIILLPQVLYRYARMLVTVELGSLVYARLAFELLLFLGAGCLLFYYRRRLTPALWWYCLAAILLPTFSGSLSSISRYLYAALPLFTVVAEDLTPSAYKLTLLVLGVFHVIHLALFTTGIFVA